MFAHVHDLNIDPNIFISLHVFNMNVAKYCLLDGMDLKASTKDR